MSRQIAQVIAIARCEMLLVRRGRMFIVILLSLLALTGILVLVGSSNESGQLLAPLVNEGVDEAGIATGAAIVVVFLTWAPLAVTLALLLPVVISDTIPRDNQIGVRELLDSLPLTTGTYLAGKVLGVWVTWIGGISVVLVLTGILWWLVFGAFDPAPYFGMVIFGAWSLIILNAGAGTLISGTQPTRRRAVALMILLMIVLPILLPASLEADSLPGLLSPVRVTILNYYLLIETSPGQLALAIGAGLIELVVIWFAVKGWLTWKQRYE